MGDATLTRSGTHMRSMVPTYVKGIMSSYFVNIYKIIFDLKYF